MGCSPYPYERAQSQHLALKPRMIHGAAGRTRTGKGVTSQQILSLLCLPFHHSGVGEYLRRAV